MNATIMLMSQDRLAEMESITKLTMMAAIARVVTHVPRGAIRPYHIRAVS
jgi:hypothetical protein